MFKLRKLIPTLLLITVILLAAALSWTFYEKSLPLETTLFVVIGIAVLISKSKAALTASLAWLVFAKLSVVFNFTQGKISFFQPSVTVVSLLVFLTIILVAAIFQSSFINQRTSFLSRGRRIKTDHTADIQSDQALLSAKIVDLSVHGLAIEGDLDFPTKQRVVISIPGINVFRLNARLVRKADKLAAFQFTGWSVHSAIQQLKILKWQFTNSNSAPRNGGFTLIEAVTVAAIGSVVLIAAASLSQTMFKLSLDSEFRLQVELLRSEIARSMNDDVAWQNTIADTNNTALDCLRNRVECTEPARQLINLRDRTNQLQVESLNPTVGLSFPRVDRCVDFDAINGSDTCPFRFETYARPICTTDCLNPVFEVQLVALLRPRTLNFPINLNKLGISLFKDPTIDSLSITCEAMQGVFDEVSGTCELQVLSGLCAQQGRYLKGISNGQPVCGELAPSLNCSPGNYLQGFNPVDGSPVCIAVGVANTPTPTPSPSPTATPAVWTAGDFSACAPARIGQACSPANSQLFPASPGANEYCQCGDNYVHSALAPGMVPPGRINATSIYCDATGTIVRRDNVVIAPSCN